jgi:hypothetical protein
MIIEMKNYQLLGKKLKDISDLSKIIYFHQTIMKKSKIAALLIIT